MKVSDSRGAKEGLNDRLLVHFMTHLQSDVEAEAFS